MGSKPHSKKFPGYTQVYRLVEPGAGRQFRASLDMSHSEALAVLSGDPPDNSPIGARWAMGASSPGDVVWTTSALPLLISERLVRRLREARYSGWEVTPVSLLGKKGEPLPPYFFLQLNGRCGPIDYRQSRRINKTYPGGVFPAWRGLYFDPNTWDGSDLFMAEGTGFKFVVEAVRETLVACLVKNLLFESLEDVELDSLP